MKNYILLYITIVSVFSFNGYSQKAKITSADKKYDSYAYVDAIKTYERVAEKGYKSADMFQKLGNAYYFNSDFEKAAKPGENIMLYKNEPKKMGKYTITYVSDTTIAPNTYYKLNFKVIDAAGKIKEDFNLNPSIQENGQMGLIASPDTKHYLTSDIYTHITSAAQKQEEHGDHEGHTEEENYKAPRILSVKAGDTIHTSSGILTVGQLNAKPVVKDLKIAEGDLAVALPLEVNVSGKLYKAEPLFMVKGNNTFDFARKIEDVCKMVGCNGNEGAIVCTWHTKLCDVDGNRKKGGVSRMFLHQWLILRHFVDVNESKIKFTKCPMC